MSATGSHILNPELEPTISAILSIHTRLFALPSLIPSPEVNSLFENLMTICLKPTPNTRSDAILSDPRILEILPSLHQLCSLSEFQLEKYWSHRISNSLNRKSSISPAVSQN